MTEDKLEKLFQSWKKMKPRKPNAWELNKQQAHVENTDGQEAEMLEEDK